MKALIAVLIIIGLLVPIWIYFLPVIAGVAGDAQNSTNMSLYTGFNTGKSLHQFVPLALFLFFIAAAVWTWWKWHTKRA